MKSIARENYFRLRFSHIVDKIVLFADFLSMSMGRQKIHKFISEDLEFIRFSIRRIPFVDDIHWTYHTER